MYAWMASAIKYIMCYNCMRKGHYYSKCPEPKVKCDRCCNPHHTKIQDTVVEEIKLREAKGKGAKQRCARARRLKV